MDDRRNGRWWRPLIYRSCFPSIPTRCFVILAESPRRQASRYPEQSSSLCSGNFPPGSASANSFPTDLGIPSVLWPDFAAHMALRWASLTGGSVFTTLTLTTPQQGYHHRELKLKRQLQLLSVDPTLQFRRRREGYHGM